MEQAAIPVFMPYLGPDTLRAVEKAFEIGWIGMGATTADFECAIADKLHTNRHVVATMTGTAALHLGLRLAGVGPGDEVIVGSFNYIADVQAIVMCGAQPVFCDIEEQTHSLDPARVQELITKKTKAIMPLHFAGIVGQIDAIHEIAHRMNVRIVEDATHALGSIHHGKAIGSGGDITCFSFDPVKIITSIDGGAVICSREEDIAQIHRWRLLGVDKDTTLRYQNKRAWEYDVTCEGWRDHMTNINAAIGLSQLARLDEFLASRRRDCATYNEAFADLQWLRVPDVNWKNVGPFIYTVRVLHGQREAFMAHLRERGVATGIHFLPLHEMTFCKDFRHGPMKVTQRVSAEIVTLPLWSQMPTDIRDLVIDAVRSYEPVEAMASGAR